jgi:uncharacterized protein YndB with AHSA1/START domain
MNHDRIEKKVLLNAPLERVWRAISEAPRFGAWFGMEVDGGFDAGTRVRAKIRPTRVDAAIAEMQKPYDGVAFELLIERIEPMRHFAFRWHPGVPESENLPDEQMTLVEFTLEQKADGVLLTITESGFERIPLARRADAFAGNDGGWTHQLDLIGKYLLLDRDGALDAGG